MKTLLFLLATLPAFAQIPLPGSSTGGGGSGPSATVAATPDYIVVPPSAMPEFTAKPFASSTYWSITMAANITSSTLVTTDVPDGQLMGWRFVQGGAGSYTVSVPAAVLNAPVMDGTFCNGVGDAMVMEGVFDGTNVLITDSECVPATPPTAASFQNGSSGIVTFETGSFTVGPAYTPPSEPANYGYAFPPGAFNGDFSGALAFSANQVKVFPFVSGPNTWTLTRARIKITVAQAAEFVYVGVYDATCSTLLSSGSVTAAATGDGIAVTMSSYVMTPGIYRVALGATHASIVLGALGLGASTYTSFTTGTAYMGNAANAISGSALPASCGAVTGTPTVFPFVFLAAQ